MLDYGFNFMKAPTFCDNDAATKIVRKPIQHSRTKHIDVKIHSIRDAFEKGFMDIIFIPTEEQRAVIFTKAFDKTKFLKLIKMLGMISFS